MGKKQPIKFIDKFPNTSPYTYEQAAEIRRKVIQMISNKLLEKTSV